MEKQKVDLSEQYRRQGGHLYERIGNSYVHCYQNALLARASLEELVAAYYNRLLEEQDGVI